MIDEILQDADERMGKTLDALTNTFGKIRTGRANPALLDGITVDYYGVATPLNQVASISVEDARAYVAFGPLGTTLSRGNRKSHLAQRVGNHARK